MIFLFMDGGPSQMDTFDPKARLQKESGQPIRMDTPATVFQISRMVLGSPFSFKRHGHSGAAVSELFPPPGHLRGRHDLRSVHGGRPLRAHRRQLLHAFRHRLSGPAQPGILGDLRPGKRVGQSPRLRCAGERNDSARRSGPVLAADFCRPPTREPCSARGATPSPTSDPARPPRELQLDKLGLIRKLNAGVVDRFGPVSELEATIANYELAFRMQSAVPELLELGGESEATRKLYGLDEPETEEFGRECLLARRLVERGVRFIECLSPQRRIDRWDQHHTSGRTPPHQRQGHGQADCRTVEGPQGSRPAGSDPGGLGRRIRQDPHGPGPG